MTKQQLIAKHNEILAEAKKEKAGKILYFLIVGFSATYILIHSIIYLT